jgi:hypothetical protein
MSLTKLSLGGNNDVVYKLFPPRESLEVTPRLGMEISKSFFYGVAGKIWTLYRYSKYAVMKIYDMAYKYS